MLVVAALTLLLVPVQPRGGRVASSGPLDVCALLTSAEIKTVLGDPLTERKPNADAAGGVLMSQCFFATSSPRSISLAVAGTRGAGRSRITPRAYWRRQFHPSRRDKAEESERDNTPRPIAGVGEEAFWAGNRIAGALYVLHRNTFLRISVGGIRDGPERIQKSKALALLALRRMTR